MSSLKEAAVDFLAQKRIAVAGVSRSADIPANFIYRKLRETGHDVYAVNPNTDIVEGDVCYADLSAIPVKVDGVVIATPPKLTRAIVQQCSDAGINRVWIHRSFGAGSADKSALDLCRQLDLSVIPGSCPMMFCEPVDIAHKCMRWFFRVSGKQADPERY
jgi:predicted CoA-binding protein